MFFYRAWVGNEGRYPQSALWGPEVFQSQFSYHRWGYAALLLLTLAFCVVLNAFFLASFVVNFAKQKLLPHVAFLFLSIRDLLIALVLIPICIDWFIVNVGFFEGSEALCKFAGFLEFFLAAEYPLILISLSLILYSRKYPKLDQFGMPLDEFNPDPAIISPQFQPEPYRGSSRPQSVSSYRQPSSKPPSVIGSVTNGYRAPSVASSNAGFRPVKPPSVAGSDTGYRNRGNGAFKPQRPVMLNTSGISQGRPGSVTGSIEGRLAAGRRAAQYQQQQSFMASSPLQEEEEDCDLWEEASLDYPGNQSPRGWEYLGDPEEEMDPLFYEEPKYHTWHYICLGLTWVLALAIGVPAAMFVEYRPYYLSGDQKKARPGCYIPADPFKNPYSYTVSDPGFNFTLSNLIVTYILPVVALILLLVLIFCKKLTDSGKFKRYVKILTCVTLVFILSRSPMDIIQLKGVIEAAMGFKQLNVLPYQLEYEILLIWTTYLPLILHPIIYFCFCSEYRQGGVKGVRSCCGCPPPSEDQKAALSHYKEEEILASRSTVSKTQVSNIL